jgi:hypothetical protein
VSAELLLKGQCLPLTLDGPRPFQSLKSSMNTWSGSAPARRAAVVHQFQSPHPIARPGSCFSAGSWRSASDRAGQPRLLELVAGRRC